MNSFIIKDINISFNDIFKIINEDLNLSIHPSVIDKIAIVKYIINAIINKIDNAG